LFEEEQMQALYDEEMESSSKIDLKDVSFWLSIKETCRPGVLITTKLSKEGCIFLGFSGATKVQFLEKHMQHNPP
jgi:hypothetical protein